MQQNGKILIVDDDQGVLYTARMILKDHFKKLDTENNPVTAYERIGKEKYDIIILDMNFRSGATSGEEGLKWLQKLHEINPEAYIIMDTAYGDIQVAVASMKLGAVDFLTKPWSREKLLSTVKNAFELIVSKKKVRELESSQEILLGDMDKEFGEFIWKDPVMKPVIETIDKIANTDANILILGENGTGKELVARNIHRKSSRSWNPFIKVDLAAIPESLFESELFGHVKGAFTDARENRTGRFEMAEKGSLFLDEIGNLNLNLQAKLLTAIQSKTIQKVGSSDPVVINCRLICATNKDIEKESEKGQFRQDLLYRINTISIDLPPLRRRPQDIPGLIRHFLNIYSKKYKKHEVSVGFDTMESLMDYPWPGNIRELRHAVERAVIMAHDKELKVADFLSGKDMTNPFPRITEDTVNMMDIEKKTILNAIQKNTGNLSKAAEELGIGRTTLYRKIRKFRINIQS